MAPPSPLDLALNMLLFLTPLAHLLVAPHTKVEESFNLQAVHDVLVYGTPTGDGAGAALRAAYDHFAFPGAVPRTFVGAVLLAGVSQPLIALLGSIRSSSNGFAAAQFVVRAALGTFNAASLLVFRRAVDSAFGKATGRWWLALVISQFHLIFYLSRTLPNMFSFGLTTLASAFLLPKATPALSRARQKQALLFLVVSAAVFRAETAILLATTCLTLLARRATTTTIPQLIALITGLSLASLLVTVPIDSYFWQRVPLWPELAGFYYNAVLGSSSAWGTSPWHYYFLSALPRLLLNPLALLLAAFALLRPAATSRPAAELLAPNLLFVAVYSVQPHKELRFVLYVAPALAAAAALGANYVFARRTKTLAYALVSLALPLSILASAAASAGMLLLSSLNYPGGDAVAQLFQLTHTSSSTTHMSPAAAATTPPRTVSVHADVLTCMTGLTLFGQNPHGLPLAHGAPAQLPAGVAAPLLMFDKTEDESEMAEADFWTRFDYVLAEDPDKITSGQWETVGVVQGYAGIEVLRPGAVAHGDNAEVSPEETAGLPPRVLGRGAVVKKLRDAVRGLTGGWYVGPRMAPRIHIMKQVTVETDNLKQEFEHEA